MINWIHWNNYDFDLKKGVHQTNLEKIFTEYLSFLTRFVALLFFFTPWKHKKTKFQLFSGGMENDQWHGMG